MAAATLDDSSIGPSETLAYGTTPGVFFQNDLANTSVHVFSAIADTNTYTLSNWRGPVPVDARVHCLTAARSISVEWAMSGADLVFTFYVDTGSPAGYLTIWN